MVILEDKGAVANLHLRSWQVQTMLKLRHVVKWTQADVRMSNLFDAQWRLIMAVKKAQGKEAKKAEFRGFINIDIPTDRKIEAKAFILQTEEISILIEQAVASQYKFSFTRNDKNDTYIASMQCNDGGSPNGGYVLSAHANHWYDALGVLVWKHFILLEQNWHVEKTVGLDDIG